MAQIETIKTPEINNDFKHHLDLSDNHRVLFSGKFGTGKTFFLKQFFKTEEKNYHAIKLFPVNYSVASNEDIFELIKYDILFELIKSGVQFEEDEFSLLLLSQVYVQENAKDILKNFFKFIPHIGKPLSEIFEKLIDQQEKFDKFCKERKIDKEEEIKTYLKTFTKKKGSIYEEDAITSLIKSLIYRLRKDEAKKIVLVIEDLDRIDPEHIFRLLNIFAAHFDLHYANESENKFGFDKVIVVCDLNNVRNIFHAKYGSETDFSGYIDKFYSREIFFFDNRKYIQKIISELLLSVKIKDNNTLQKQLQESNNIFHLNLVFNIFLMIDFGLISIREVLKLKDTEIVPFMNRSEFNTSNAIGYTNGFEILNFMLKIKGDSSSLLQSIENCVDHLRLKDVNDVRVNLYIGFLIPIMHQSKLNLEVSNHVQNFSVEDGKHKNISDTITYTLVRNPNNDGWFAKIDNINSLMYFKVLRESVLFVKNNFHI